MLHRSATLHGKTLHLESSTEDETIIAALKALASLPRWRILQYLTSGTRAIGEVAEALDMPPSTAAAHIKILEEAGFLYTELQPASHGLQKVCTRTYDNFLVQLPQQQEEHENSIEVSMPIGAFSEAEVSPTCGLASNLALIGYLDDPLSFYEPERITAGLLWFRNGFVEYQFPNRLPEGATLLSLQLSMEICSEAPLHNHDWPSDITLWINDREIGTWTCPGDFGGQRGRLTPQWWDSKDSQFGLLKRWQVSAQGSFIDGHRLSSVTVTELDIDRRRPIRVRLGVKPEALHVGGINLFGATYGNYPQDLILRFDYLPGQRRNEQVREELKEQRI